MRRTKKASAFIAALCVCVSSVFALPASADSIGKTETGSWSSGSSTGMSGFGLSDWGTGSVSTGGGGASSGTGSVSTGGSLTPAPEQLTLPVISFDGGKVYGQFAGYNEASVDSSGSSTGRTDTYGSVTCTSSGKTMNSTVEAVTRRQTKNGSMSVLMNGSSNTQYAGGGLISATSEASGTVSSATGAGTLQGRIYLGYPDGKTAEATFYAEKKNAATPVSITYSAQFSDRTGVSIQDSIAGTYGVEEAALFCIAYSPYHDFDAQGGGAGSGDPGTGGSGSASQGGSSSSGTSTGTSSGSSRGTTQAPGSTLLPASGNADSNGKNRTGANSDIVFSDGVSKGRLTAGTSALESAYSQGSSLVVSSTATANGKQVKVGSVKTGAVRDKKYRKITFNVDAGTKFGKGILRGKKALGSSKVVINAVSGGKLKASNFHKKAFTGYRKTVVITKRSISKKEFGKLKRKLKKGGFRGKLKRK